LEPVNLSWEVLDGIRAHTWKVEPGPATPEGAICRYADRIAYLVHDMDDAIRAGILRPSDVPQDALDAFGKPGSEWVGTMIRAVVQGSLAAGELAMEAEKLAAMNRFRDFMFDNVYLRPEANLQAEKAVKLIRDLVDYFLEQPDRMPTTYRHRESTVRTQVIDFVAGMSDRYALRVHDGLFRPSGQV
jgi:dGTPase